MKPPKFQLNGITLVNAGGALVIMYLLVVLIQTVNHNYQMGQQIKGLNSQISLLQDQKSALSDSIAYYQTNSYRDRQARSQLGLQLPGENVVIIPNSKSASDDSDSANATGTATNAPATAAAPKSNFAQWVSFLSGG